MRAGRANVRVRTLNLHRWVCWVGYLIVSWRRSAPAIVGQQAWRLEWWWTWRDGGLLITVLADCLLYVAICLRPERVVHSGIAGPASSSAPKDLGPNGLNLSVSCILTSSGSRSWMLLVYAMVSGKSWDLYSTTGWGQKQGKAWSGLDQHRSEPISITVTHLCNCKAPS